MKGDLKERAALCVTFVLSFVIFFVASMLVNNSGEKSAILGSEDGSGVYFTYEGTTYQVFIIKEMGEYWTYEDLAICIPDDYEYSTEEDKEFCQRYDLYNGYCDCIVEYVKLGETVTVTMNLSGEPKEYTLNLEQFNNRDINEVLYISGEGIRGYAFAINKMNRETTNDEENKCITNDRDINVYND